MTGTKAGTAKITATIGGSDTGLSTSVTLTALTPVAANSALTASPESITADGITSSTIMLTLKDANKYAVSGQEVAFVSSLSGTTFSAVTDKGHGTYTATMTGTTAGTAEVSATVGGAAFGVTAASVTLNADRFTSGITSLTTESDNAFADGSETNTVKVTMKDSHGKVVPDYAVDFSATNGATIASSGVTGADGTVSVTLTSTTTGTSTVTATANGSSLTTQTTFLAIPKVGAFTVVSDGAKANGIATNSVKATITDSEGVPLPNYTVSFSAAGGVSIAPTGVTGADGTVTVTLTSTAVGSIPVQASVRYHSWTIFSKFVSP